MRILVMGLGSMGKRRVRNLQALGYTQIIGVDSRVDRQTETNEAYGIATYASIDEALSENGKIEAMIISLPPDVHHTYMDKALELNVPCFIEASVLDTNFEALKAKAAEKKVLLAPSCTLYFHPAVKKIKEVLDSAELGTLSCILYHSGQYLPDWHTYEKVSDYYVSNPATGGAREIVPFELTWMTHVLGFPKACSSIFKKTIEIEGAEKIDDTYSTLLDYGSFFVNLTVDVVSRYATRRLIINGSKKQLVWDWNENCVKIYDPTNESWHTYEYQTKEAHSGYNKNITEQMYIDEMQMFTQAALGKTTYINTLEHDHSVLKLLYSIETNKIG
jgi:predicted dehydrogenase